MNPPFLLSRVLLRFNADDDDLIRELSAAAVTPDGHLWLGSDEFRTIERLTPLEPCVYGEHRAFDLTEFFDMDEKDEVDIEGMDYSAGFLWFTGSHSTKRKKPKGKKTAKDLDRLATVEKEQNRYLLGRIPEQNGELLKTYNQPDTTDGALRAAALRRGRDGNTLTDALSQDEHLKDYLIWPLPSKENGFDIEGLAVAGERVFLGFRGPVLRGYAVILEIQPEETEPGILDLKPIGPKKQCYRKHFVDLDGLGIRELCVRGKDLIILAGATMDIQGAMRLFVLRDALKLENDSVVQQAEGRLEVVFDLPYTQSMGNAEGLALVHCLGEDDALMVVYDDPHPTRRPIPHAIFMDIFRLGM